MKYSDVYVGMSQKCPVLQTSHTSGYEDRSEDSGKLGMHLDNCSTFWEKFRKLKYSGSHPEKKTQELRG